MIDDLRKDKQQTLSIRMAHLGVAKADIRETFVRSSGPGGQNVNKVASCVILQHIPTGIQVKYQEERAQSQNRLGALYLLLDKLEARQQEIEFKKKHLDQKIKRQNRKKPQALKEQILQNKHRKSEKKNSRAKVRPHKMETEF